MADKIPRSVAMMNKHPYLFGKLQIGTIFYNMLCALRNIYDIVVERQRFQLLSNPALKQSTGGSITKMEYSTTNYAISGVVRTLTGANEVAVAAGSTTTAGQFRCITLSVSAAAALTQTVSDVAAAAPVTPPTPPTADCVLATIQIPASFTPGTTTFLTAWVTNGWTSQQAIWAAKPAELPNVDM